MEGYTGSVRGSRLRLISLVLLLVVGSLSTARAICVLPCLGEHSASDAAGGRHCDHAASEPIATIDAHDSACDDCGDVAFYRADRLEVRNGIAASLAASASVSAPHVFGDTLDLSGDAGLPPGIPISTAVPLPLRI